LMTKKKNVAESEAGAPPGHPDWVNVRHPKPPPGKIPMLPVLQFTRGPETPEENAAYELWNKLWNGLFEAVVRTPQPKRSRGPGLSTLAIGIAWTLYVRDHGVPSSMRGLVQAVHAYATAAGLPFSDHLDDRMSREFLTPIVDAVNRGP
jgi:hypothetical protein